MNDPAVVRLPDRSYALTPETLAMVDAIARTGSFAAAARELGKVPSALTYSVRQLEDALDVLLFDRSSRQAQFTAAGTELLLEGRRLLQATDAVANRVQRVASGWETQLAISIDDVMSMPIVFELVQAFCDIREVRGTGAGSNGPPTRLRLQSDVLTGTWEALVTGQVDLAIGVGAQQANPGGIELRPLGELGFVFCVAPHHPLAALPEPLSDAQLVHHRAVAVADTAQRLTPTTLNLLPGQDVLTVASMRTKLEALLRGLGCGFVPEPLARPHLEAGRLVTRQTARGAQVGALHYAWRSDERGLPALGPGAAMVAGAARAAGHAPGLAGAPRRAAGVTPMRADRDCGRRRDRYHDHHHDHYRGRFAPSPTGPLHAGSLVAALASWLDARAHGGDWLLRIEDIDSARCSAAAATLIGEQLAACGLQSGEETLWQSTRGERYATALRRLDRRRAGLSLCLHPQRHRIGLG